MAVVVELKIAAVPRCVAVMSERCRGKCQLLGSAINRAVSLGLGSWCILHIWRSGGEYTVCTTRWIGAS